MQDRMCANCGDAPARRIYCSSRCKDAAGHRRRYVPTPRMFADRRCEVADCDAQYFAKGMCKPHYRRDRWAQGLDGRTNRQRETVLNAMCSRFSAFAPKAKPVRVALTIGIMPTCPSCSGRMAPMTPDHFLCCGCSTDAKFNAEEVSWLASENRSTARSVRTAN